MDPVSARPSALDHEAAEFVRFCYRRRRVGWPELYDEMCAVAARGLYLGMDTDDLAGLGIGFSLFDMAALAGLANAVVAEEHSKRRPVAVTIVAAGDLGSDVAGHSLAAGAGPGLAAGAGAGHEAVAGAVLASTESERSFDVPIRLAPVPAGV